jgi:NAD-dependent deacetylase
MSVSIPAELISQLRTANHLVVMTGAGVSAESGVPTFRDAQTGLWAKYEPTELATPQAFSRDPKLVWEWYVWRKGKVEGVLPNAGHHALVELQKLASKLTLITQNVDGLHQQAGSDSVIELHGSIMRAKCFEQNHIADEWPDDSQQQPPICKSCGSLMRPDVVWFNESLPAKSLQSAAEASRNCDVFFSIGTSSVVHPAAALAVSAAESGATLVEINPNTTPLTHQADYVLQGASGVILPAIVNCLKKQN